MAIGVVGTNRSDVDDIAVPDDDVELVFAGVGSHAPRLRAPRGDSRVHTPPVVAQLHMDWNRLLRDWGRVTAGILLVVLGVVGLVLPILPGILPILAGLALLAPESKFVQSLKERMKHARRGLGSGSSD
jgi:hypothetical protein